MLYSFYISRILFMILQKDIQFNTKSVQIAGWLILLKKWVSIEEHEHLLFYLEFFDNAIFVQETNKSNSTPFSPYSS